MIGLVISFSLQSQAENSINVLTVTVSISLSHQYVLQGILHLTGA